MSAAHSIVSIARPTGRLSPRLIPGPGALRPARKAPGWAPIPAGLSTSRKIASASRELSLHFRLAGKGFWRGLALGSGVIATSRLCATKLICQCGSLKDHNAHYGQPCPVASRDRRGLISTKVIGDAGVTFLRDDWNNNAQDYTTFNFHGSGTGTNAEAVGDVALQTECTTALNPDSTRPTGTRSVPASNQWRSVGTSTYDADAAITEHGIFSASGTGTGTLWDRSKFAAINVVGASGDSIQWTYSCSLASGG